MFDLFCLFPLHLSRIAIFDFREPYAIDSNPRLFYRELVLPPDLNEGINSTFREQKVMTDEQLREVGGYMLGVLDKEREGKVLDYETLRVLFIKGNLSGYLKGLPGRTLSFQFYSRTDPFLVGRGFSSLIDEEKRNFNRDLVTGNVLAGFGTIWERQK